VIEVRKGSLEPFYILVPERPVWSRTRPNPNQPEPSRLDTVQPYPKSTRFKPYLSGQDPTLSTYLSGPVLNPILHDLVKTTRTWI